MKSVHYFKIGEQDRPFYFNLNSVQVWCRLNAKKMKDFEAIFTTSRMVEKNYEPAELRDLLYAGLHEGNRLRNGVNNPDFSPEDVGAWMEDVSAKDFAKMYDVIVEYLIPDEALKLYKKKAKPKKAKATDTPQSES